jgi:hypothetical protein
MATLYRYLHCVGFAVAILLSGCASHPRVACVGDAESLGYHDGSQGQHSCAATLSGADSLAYQGGWNEGIQRFCTEDNGYQQGCQGAAFSNVCPDPLASSYLDGYQAGYSIYLSQLEVDALERSIELKTNELEQVWSMLDAVAHNLEQSDSDPEQRSHWLDESVALTTRQSQLGAQLDELEADVSARKAQLTQQRSAIAINY